MTHKELLDRCDEKINLKKRISVIRAFGEDGNNYLIHKDGYIKDLENISIVIKIYILIKNWIIRAVSKPTKKGKTKLPKNKNTYFVFKDSK